MKISIKENPNIRETEVVIHCSKADEMIEKIIKHHIVKFDIENNTKTLQIMLEDLIGHYTEQEDFTKAVLEALHHSPRLIPFCAHRCFFDGMDGMPIVSFWQAVDTIFYGSDLENYLENEFIASEFNNNTLGKISDNMKNTGIWYYIIE